MRLARRTIWLVVLLLPLAGCAGLTPSQYRDWSPDQAVLPHAEIEADRAVVHNIRNCVYLPDKSYVVRHYDKAFDLRRIESVDFFVVPFRDSPGLAHTMLSFGFQNGERVAVSVEIRRTREAEYSVLKGLLRQFELMYVVGDEQDLVKLRSNIRKDDVYLYRARATPEQTRELFVDVLQRVNQLAERPEFYDLFTNNCTTNIVRHVNHLSPHKVRYGWEVLLPGYSDRLAYDLGLLDTDLPFEEAKRRARITEVAQNCGDGADFSATIRR
jgi:hypothetical protein